MLNSQRAVIITCSTEQLENLITKSVNEAIAKHALKQASNSEKLNQKQAADFLGVTLPTIIDWKKKGLIPYHQVPNTRRIFYYKSELLEVTRKL